MVASLWVLHRDRNGAVEAILEVDNDITELKEARRQLAAIVESSGDAIISKDLEGIILTWNKGAERLYGYSGQEVVGRPMTVLLPPDRRHEEAAILERLKRGHHVEQFETIRRRRDGRLVNVSLTSSPIHSRDGRIVGAAHVERDVTERVQAEVALRETEADLLRHQEELRSLAVRLIDSQEEERRRVARELHDDFTEKLAMLRM